MTGAGKSAVGRQAAKMLGLRFADADEKICQLAGKSIPDIFAQDGETRFRELETRALADILAEDGAVASVGGGAVLRPQNRALMRKRGLVAHLDASVELLRARLDDRQRESRPLLKNGASIGEMHRARAPLYHGLADVSLVPSAAESPAEVAERLLQILRESPATVRVPLPDGRDYPVTVGRGLLQNAGQWVKNSPRVFIVRDRNFPAWESVVESVRAAGCACEVFSASPSEHDKSMRQLCEILDCFADFKLGRDGAVVALGGGVVGDLAGFAAAVYMRGIKLIQAPTTLLAQVDSAVGGKTGVNHRGFKNLAGAFHQSSAVLCDLDALDSLPDARKREGLAEVVKYGLLGDAAFFNWMEKNADAVSSFQPDAVRRIVIRSTRAKAAVVAADERESNTRALLNLGHTFAHAVESAAEHGSTKGGWEWAHGNAVAVGLVAAAELSSRVLDFPRSDVGRIRGLLSRLKLPSRLPGGMAAALRDAMRMDKKNRAGRERFVLMRAVGDAVANQSVSESDLFAALEAASS